MAHGLAAYAGMAAHRLTVRLVRMVATVIHRKMAANSSFKNSFNAFLPLLYDPPAQPGLCFLCKYDVFSWTHPVPPVYRRSMQEVSLRTYRFGSVAPFVLIHLGAAAVFCTPFSWRLARLAAL